MQTVKTGVVVVLLLAVCYGAFVALNAPEPELPPELKEWAAEDGEFETLVDIDMGTSPTSLPTVALPSVSLPTASTSDVSQAGESLQPKLLPVPGINQPESLSVTNSANLPNSLPVTGSDTKSGIKHEAESLVESLASESKSSTEFPSIPLAAESTGTTSMAKQPDSDQPFKVAGNVVQAGPLLPTNGLPATQGTENRLPAFKQTRESALKLAADGKLAEALATISKHYSDPELTSEEHADMLDILDSLAREVIFSQRNLLMPAFATGPVDTVASVASKHRITPELLNTVNQLGNAQALVQGQKLKVMEGPFRGEVNLTRRELTLFLGDMYACRFPISTGTDPAPKPGSYEVADKRKDRTYYGAGEKVISATDPLNPYGGIWIDLGHQMCIHSSPEMTSTELSNAGCVSLAPIDASDVYIMLTQGSRIDIR